MADRRENRGIGEQVTIRGATVADLAGVKALDHTAFAPQESAEVAADGEFERGVTQEGLIVAVSGDEIVGFVQFGPTIASDWFIYGAAVAPQRRGEGYAGRLVEAALAAIRGHAGNEIRVAATTAPSNTAMVRVLTGAGFVGTAWVEDYFGPGKDRLYFELVSGGSADFAERILIPTTSVNSVKTLLQSKRHLIAAVRLPHGWTFEIATPLDSEPATAQTNEVAVSSAFAGTLMAAFTFVFGFALATAEIGADLLAASGIGVLVSLLALIAYTNASGDLARLRPRAWDRFIRVGNSWSEFGAVYLLFALTPALVLSATDGSVGGGCHRGGRVTPPRCVSHEPSRYEPPL
ncbi:MAG: GNAT family N-acetyltransferase [Microbacterium sp.]|jgi:ribosomal protein S18 acetylase RimI-like enzyme|uniref:GNAT family N-acetyltransferase n=1 Tax=Microbacterium sp. TaxID=51671 RepID=UPI0025DF7C2D|nr:N-acetyltransferase [Microbacterium sp.]MBQ9917189.1 GNAT family N-acetyltransferase [Microbacterium sp.]